MDLRPRLATSPDDVARHESDLGKPAARWWLALGVAIVALGLFLPGIGAGDFVGDDEALDAGVVTEMARSGDWLFAEFNGEYLPPKPPLFYWAARGVAALTGRVDEWSLRVPSALAGAATVGVTVFAVAGRQGPAAGVLAGCLLATMPIVREQARIGRCDMLLALLVTSSLFLVPAGWESGRRRWLFTSLLGLAALAKGGAGGGLIVAVLLAVAVAERRLRVLRILVDPAIVAFLVIGGSWYALAAWHWGARFVDEQLIGENFHHLVGGTAISDLEPGTRGIGYHLGYYARNVFVTTLPWGLFLPAALIESWRASATGRESPRFLSAWVIGGLVFFTLAARKSPYYLLPLAPAVAALVAGWMLPRIPESATPLSPPIGARGVLGALAFSVLLWLGTQAVSTGGCEWPAIAAALGRHPLVAIGALWSFGVAAVFLLGAARERHWRASLVASLCAIGCAWLVLDTVEGGVGDCRSLEPFARELALRVAEREPVFFFERPLPAVALYAERRIPTLRDPAAAAPATPFFLVVPESLRSEVPPPWLEKSHVVATGRGRVFTRRVMGIELLLVSEPAHS